MAQMLAEGKRRKRRKPATSNLPAAPRRRKPRTVSAAPLKRRRKRKPGMLSAGSPLQALIMQGGLAIAGGMAGKVARNALPGDMNPYLKTAIVAGGGVLVAYVTKQPMIGAGMIGSAGAYAAAVVGENFNIPLLKEQSNAAFVRLAENRPQLYSDQYGKPLKRVGDQFYTVQGQLTGFKPSDFKPVN